LRLVTSPSGVTPESGPAREQDAGRRPFGPRPADDDEEPSRQRQLRRQRRRNRLRWYVLFSIPTLALGAMAAWALFGGSTPSATTARPRTHVELEATVKKADGDSGTVHLTSDMLGIFGATLYVTKDTKVELSEGKAGTLTNLQEGTHVRASYDLIAGRKMATRIVVVPKEAAGEGRPRQETGHLSSGRR
jgi:hypothetical protein